MDSYQNLIFLENLYRLKALGYDYIDPMTPNRSNHAIALPGSLDELSGSISQCYLCDLSKSRRQSMSGYGNPGARVMLVDGYVSAPEDESNGYYVGRSGAMLRDMIENVLTLTIEDVFVTHAVKCKPFGFQNPSQSEIKSCAPFLTRQIEIIAPDVIVALGEDAYRCLTNDETSFDMVRGEIVPYNGSVVIAMYHPLHLLRNPSLKKEALKDLQTIKGQLK